MLISITPYNIAYKTAFYEMNVEWLDTYFYVEDYDREVLQTPEKYILSKGGHIFFAVHNNAPIGTVALMPYEDRVFELTKMAVLPKERGKQIGQKLMQHCITFCKEAQYKALVLYSNRVLENAIYIYYKYGFKEIPMETNAPYARGDIKMWLDL